VINIKQKEYDKKYCVVCGKEIPKLKYDSINRYNKKKTCSEECRKENMKGVNVKDLTNQQFGRLTVIRNSGKTTTCGNVIWECQCICGNYTNVAGGDLTKKNNNATRSCGKCSNNIFNKQDEGYWIGIDIKGEKFLFDDIDYDFIKEHTWYLDNKGYAMTTINSKKYSLHRLLLNLTDSKIEVDHKNKIRHDNRRDNLRVCNSQKNKWNKDKIKKPTSSKYIGVHLNVKNGKWIANIKYEKRKQKHLGEFSNEIDAAKAYDKICYELRKDYAVLNFPEDYNSIRAI